MQMFFRCFITFLPNYPFPGTSSRLRITYSVYVEFEFAAQNIQILQPSEQNSDINKQNPSVVCGHTLKIEHSLLKYSSKWLNITYKNLLNTYKTPL